VRDTKSAIRPQDDAPSDKKTFKRRRCQNCNALYMPTREDQKYCRTLPDPDKCRKEFYRYGSSYGPLKTGLHKAIDKKYAALFREMTARFIDERKRNGLGIAELERRIERLEKLCPGVIGQNDYDRELAGDVERAQAKAKTQAR
jgi:hypothetical protein